MTQKPSRQTIIDKWTLIIEPNLSKQAIAPSPLPAVSIATPNKAIYHIKQGNRARSSICHVFNMQP
jgi:hypothetical protein